MQSAAFVVIFTCALASNEAKTTSINDLNLVDQDNQLSDVALSGYQIVQKLDDIAQALRISNQMVSDHFRKKFETYHKTFPALENSPTTNLPFLEMKS